MEDPDRWSRAKIGRARQHILELQGRMTAWLGAQNPTASATIADDRLSWEVRLGDFSPPPLAEWALIAGDAVHNLRSALDVLVWAMVDEDSLTETQARRIGFPICQEEARWDSGWSAWLRSVPADAVERIKAVQPFQRPGADPANDPMPLLGDLDNRDKHRLAITTEVSLRQGNLDHGIEFADEAAAARNAPPNVTVNAAGLMPGALITSGTTKDPIVKMRGGFQLSWLVTLETRHGNLGVTDLLGNLSSYVEQVVAYVAQAPEQTESAEPDD